MRARPARIPGSQLLVKAPATGNFSCRVALDGATDCLSYNVVAVDLAMPGMQYTSDLRGTLAPANYIVHYLNATSTCGVYVAPGCFETYGVENCILNERAQRTKVRVDEAEAYFAAHAGDGDSSSNASCGGGGGGQRRRQPGTCGGASARSNARRRACRRQCGAGRSSCSSNSKRRWQWRLPAWR